MTSLNTNYGRVKNHKLSDIIIIMIFPRNLAILAIMLLKQRERDTPADVSGIVRNATCLTSRQFLALRTDNQLEIMK